MCKGLLVSSQDFPLPFPVQLQVSCRLCMSRAVLCPCSQPGVGCQGGRQGARGGSEGLAPAVSPTGSLLRAPNGPESPDVLSENTTAPWPLGVFSGRCQPA